MTNCSKEEAPEHDNALLIAEYSATRAEMQSITAARYTVLALTITGIAAVLAAVINAADRLVHPEVISPLAITAILFPSTIVSVTLSRQFHRLSTYNAVFGGKLLRQQEAFEIYGNKRPGHWAFVKPLAFAYAWLLVTTAAVLSVLFQSCQMLVSVAIMILVHLWPIASLWGTSITGNARREDLALWAEIKRELVSTKRHESQS
jgi:hypothetical protein